MVAVSHHLVETDTHQTVILQVVEDIHPVKGVGTLMTDIPVIDSRVEETGIPRAREIDIRWIGILQVIDILISTLWIGIHQEVATGN